MQRYINNVLSVLHSFFRLFVLKAVYGKRLKFTYFQRFSPSVRLFFSGNGKIVLGHKVRAHSGVKFRVMKNGLLRIGSNSSINYNCIISCMEEIQIGNGVEFGPNVIVYDHDHDFRCDGGIKANKYKTGFVSIGDNTWIGANTTILRSTKIGKNCVIAAGSIVKGNFPDNSIIIQKRETEILKY